MWAEGYQAWQMEMSTNATRRILKHRRSQNMASASEPGALSRASTHVSLRGEGSFQGLVRDPSQHAPHADSPRRFMEVFLRILRRPFPSLTPPIREFWERRTSMEMRTEVKSGKHSPAQGTIFQDWTYRSVAKKPVPALLTRPTVSLAKEETWESGVYFLKRKRLSNIASPLLSQSLMYHPLRQRLEGERVTCESLCTLICDGLTCSDSRYARYTAIILKIDISTEGFVKNGGSEWTLQSKLGSLFPKEAWVEEWNSVASRATYDGGSLILTQTVPSSRGRGTTAGTPLPCRDPKEAGMTSGAGVGSWHQRSSGL